MLWASSENHSEVLPPILPYHLSFLQGHPPSAYKLAELSLHFHLPPYFSTWKGCKTILQCFCIYPNSSPFCRLTPLTFSSHHLSVVTNDILLAKSNCQFSLSLLGTIYHPSQLDTLSSLCFSKHHSFPTAPTSLTFNPLFSLPVPGELEATYWRWWHQRMKGPWVPEDVENIFSSPLMTYIGKKPLLC